MDRALCSPKSIYLAAGPVNQRNIPVDQDPQSRHSSFLIFSVPSGTRTCFVCEGEGGTREQKFEQHCGLVVVMVLIMFCKAILLLLFSKG